MPTPMKYDDAVRLCGPAGGRSIRKMLLDRFGVIQGGRWGSFVDRERSYLVKEGSKSGGSRSDLWSSHLVNARPFTDGVKGTAAFPAIVAQAWGGMFDDGGVTVGIGGERGARTRRYVGLGDPGDFAPSVVAGGVYRKN